MIIVLYRYIFFSLYTFSLLMWELLWWVAHKNSFRLMKDFKIHTCIFYINIRGKLKAKVISFLAYLSFLFKKQKVSWCTWTWFLKVQSYFHQSIRLNYQTGDLLIVLSALIKCCFYNFSRLSWSNINCCQV